MILSCRAAQQEIAALSQMAEQLNSKLTVTEQAGDSVDLDNLFAFLSEVQPNRNQIIDEIGERMNELVEDLDVEVCSWKITCQYGKFYCTCNWFTSFFLYKRYKFIPLLQFLSLFLLMWSTASCKLISLPAFCSLLSSVPESSWMHRASQPSRAICTEAPLSQPVSSFSKQ